MQSTVPPTPETTLRNATRDSPLLQLRVDRRLGHEWDDWDGEELENGGIFHEGPKLFFGLAAITVVAAVSLFLFGVWLIAPRLEAVWGALPEALAGLAVISLVAFGAWLAAVGIVLRTGRNGIPEVLAEGGLFPRMMPVVERVGVTCGLSRDHVGSSVVRIFNALSAARAQPGVRPDDMLVLLPRCLSKQAMQGAMEIAGRYGVPMFVASRGRYARQMIGMRRPKRVVAVACERDLVSGFKDVAGHMPVLGTTLALPDGPCKNTEVDISSLESQIRGFLGLSKNASTSQVAQVGQ